MEKYSPLDAVNGANAEFVDQMYQAYKQDPKSVDAAWALFFAGFDLGGDGRSPVASQSRETTEAEAAPGIISSPDLQIADLVHSYRELGHLIANLDPLGHNLKEHPLLALAEFGLTEADLDRTIACGNFRACTRTRLRDLIDRLKTTYCGTFAVEYMEIRDHEQRSWLQERMEPRMNKADLDTASRQQVLKRLIAAEEFEQFLQRRYVSKKRFSLEGNETLITLLDHLIEAGSELNLDEAILGMAHRGRLNVLAHILHKPYDLILQEFEDRRTFNFSGDGDVKYHQGYAYEYIGSNGQKVHLALASNPSHLELVDPVVEGMVRAKQNRKGDIRRERVIPILIHGDAAFTGQGIVMETLYLSELEAYRTGGTIHVICNNQIGFTTNPSDLRFTRYPSDAAKAIQAPVFHVNADDPEACVHAARLAMEFRQQFKADVIIHMVSYRRRGHNELDDATITQPVMYREIAEHPTVRQLYTKRLLETNAINRELHDKMTMEIREQLEKAQEQAQSSKPVSSSPPVYGPWKDFCKIPKDWSAKTGVDQKVLRDIAGKLCQLPPGFHPHPKVEKLMESRLKMLDDGTIDWGCGEMLALGSLLNEGTWVRLTGQDVCRGTFGHRHAALYDYQDGHPYVPLAKFAEGKSRFMIINTMLSELAVIGFEYGFASADPLALVMWEAQFGDFVNGAQAIIDQFIASAESKWGRYNGLVMLLPHGYEGQGPEHSHARLERFLQLAAEENIQVVNPTTPAQFFHLIRRQMHRSFRKPLIVMAPKSMLRNKLAVSTLEEFAPPHQFQEIIDETESLDRSKVRRVLVCSGKIYYELLAERTRHQIKDIAIIRVEQIYPFPAERLTEISKTFPQGVELFYVQEEPRNNGVYPFIGAKLHYHWVGMRKVTYVGRKPSASPAAGSHEQHVAEQTDIINRSLGISPLIERVPSRETRQVEVKTDEVPVPGK